MHYIGRNVPSSGQYPISDGAIAGPWDIAGQTYNTQRFAITDGPGQVSYLRNKDLDDSTSSTEVFAYVKLGTFSTLQSSWTSAEVLYAVDDLSTDYIGTHTHFYYKNAQGAFIDVTDNDGSSPGVQQYLLLQEYTHNLTSGEKQPEFGSVATYQASPTSRELEFVFGPDGWSEFGSTGSLKALAFKDTANVTASGSCTPQGTNAASVVTFQTPGELPTMVYDSVNETLTFNQGSFPSGGVAAAQIFTGSNTDVSVSGTAS